MGRTGRIANEGRPTRNSALTQDVVDSRERYVRAQGVSPGEAVSSSGFGEGVAKARVQEPRTTSEESGAFRSPATITGVLRDSIAAASSVTGSQAVVDVLVPHLYAREEVESCRSQSEPRRHEVCGDERDGVRRWSQGTWRNVRLVAE